MSSVASPRAEVECRAGGPLYGEILEFLYREAELLDSNRYAAWLDLFKSLDEQCGTNFYSLLHFILGDYSPTSLERALAAVAHHGSHAIGVPLDALNPYTVGQLLKGRQLLRQLEEASDAAAENVHVAGAIIPSVRLAKGVAAYTMAIDWYLGDRIVTRLEAIADQVEPAEWPSAVLDDVEPAARHTPRKSQGIAHRVQFRAAGRARPRDQGDPGVRVPMGEQHHLVSARSQLARQHVDDPLDAAIEPRRNGQLRISGKRYAHGASSA